MFHFVILSNRGATAYVNIPRWFRHDFFTYVDNPPCSLCGTLTIFQVETTPTREESARGATKTELHDCSNDDCGACELSSRYENVWTLMQTWWGRGKEWANYSTMLCRAMGVRARFVWHSDENCWTEMYSDTQTRWIHVDACEESWDMPQFYAQTWGKNMDYCIAFSNDGATDVTRRHVRKPEQALSGTICSEEALESMIRKT